MDVHDECGNEGSHGVGVPWWLRADWDGDGDADADADGAAAGAAAASCWRVRCGMKAGLGSGDSDGH
jgi:hypothetical protein